jgi:hypothetical protein
MLADGVSLERRSPIPYKPPRIRGCVPQVRENSKELVMPSRRLRTVVNSSLVLGAIALASAAGESSATDRSGGAFPYVAYVIEADTYVRSGPGSEHYPTGQVPAGYAVEVYRHDGEGWCAIRPPEGSFSLAPAHQLRILDSRTAEVTASGVVARVGSGLGEQRNAVQVLLERGEAVQLAAQPIPGEPWVKITPPAGEFRWIASRRLSRTPPMEGAAARSTSWVSSPGGSKSMGIPTQAGAAPASAEIAPTGSDAFAHLKNESIESTKTASNDAYPAWHPESVAMPTAAAAAPSDQIEVVAGSPAEVVLAQHQEAAAATGTIDGAPADAAAVKSGQPRVRFPGLSAGGPADPRVAEMQLRLSKIVVQPPTTWQLAALREETAASLAQEQSPQVRDQLRDLLDRVATFEAVQARYRATPNLAAAALPAGAPGQAPSPPGETNPAMTGQTADVLARVRSDLGVDNSITPTPGGPAAAGTAAATEALYDAVGTLKPVVSRRDQAPRYALVDDHGDVVTFVTASADVNLQPFVGKRIGVRGNRGFMPEYRRAHVTASRVTPLEEKLVR